MSVFEPFKQDEQGFEKGGTGLGLAISKKQIQVLSGQLNLESEVGKGSKFFFTIPLHPVDDEKKFQKNQYDKVQSLKKGQKVTALLIDDIQENRDVLSGFLKSIKVEVYEADEGMKGLSLIKETRPDIVFLDILMPGMDGLEVFDKIKSDPQNRDLKIVCITASAFDQQRTTYLEKGFDFFISKPFKADEIFEALAKNLSIEFEYKEKSDFEDLEVEETEMVFSEIKVSQKLIDKIIYSAEVCSITELDRYLKELNSKGNGCSQLSIFLKILLKDYDMDSIIEYVKKITPIAD
jgi:CheY-like chemotaxis protein